MQKKKMRINTEVLLVGSALFAPVLVSGFVQRQRSSVVPASAAVDPKIAFRTSRSCRSSPTFLPAFGPEHIDAINSGVDQFHLVLADAAATADVVAKDPSWWDNYLQIFKNTLNFVHETVDQPLRNAGITQTWGVSIALFTAGIRSLLIPISVQQTKGAEYMKALKPYITEIKEKFKDNKDAQNRAIGKLYEDANQNPLSGCLLSILQLPVLLGLYRGIRLLAMEGKLEEPFLWIPSLEGPVGPPDFRGMDWLTQGWHSTGGTLPEPQLGWTTTLSFLIMPVLLVLGQSLTMRVLSPPMDEDATGEEKEQMEQSQAILKFLPLMIGYFSLQVPAGLTIYWFTSNVFSLTQSLAVRAYYSANPPEINLPDYWDSLENLDEMSAEERRKAAEAGLATGPKFSDLLEEAKFHYVVHRNPLREESEAWQRVQAEGITLPTEMSAWVEAGGPEESTAHSQSPPAEVDIPAVSAEEEVKAAA